ncbi:hypothetical protein POM88_045415 [Heracleum sosnowskyi]|uniref:Uncharacterized protein n=1 Tax=Heracleum sosnowskyi TaxID=360622 RepID=A0AAD8H6X9_9APIA|nr:hypothetical protein POM88_045415 [Heracleum sosnowskyi]
MSKGTIPAWYKSLGIDDRVQRIEQSLESLSSGQNEIMLQMTLEVGYAGVGGPNVIGVDLFLATYRNVSIHVLLKPIPPENTGTYNQLEGCSFKSDCRPMQQKDTNKLAVGNKGIADHTSQLEVVEKPKIDDYDSKFQATRHKLHEGYQQDREFKQKRQIQLIDFQISVTKRSRFNAKSKEKPSLRQKLMAMGTRKSNKKFPFTSCVH